MDTYNGYVSMFTNYNTSMNSIMSAMVYMSSHYSYMNPGNFLLLQFLMGQITQVGEAISNMIATLNSVINNSIRNFKQ